MPESRRLPASPKEVFYFMRYMRKNELFGAIPTRDEELVAFANERTASAQRRAQWVEALRQRRDGEAYGAATLRSLERLARSETHVVVAGQQPALLGGPLMIHTKILTAIAWVERLETLGIPAVPVFWMADEDHDVGEVEPGGFRRGHSDPVFLDLPFERSRRPIRSLVLDHPEEWSARALDALSGLPHRDEVAELLERTQRASVVRGFEAMLHALYGEFGLITLSPFDLRTLQGPILAREAARPGALREQVGRSNAALERHHSTPPIEQVAELPFFWFDADGGRHRIEWHAEAQRATVKAEGGPSFDASELVAAIEHDPSRFSPDALLRPLVQDELFEPLVSIVGPTEMGYQLQLGEAYAARGLARPLLSHRLRIRTIDEADRAMATEGGARLDQLRAEDDPREWVPSQEASGWVRELSWRADPFLELLSILSDEERFSRPLTKRTSRLKRRLQEDVAKLRDAIRREVGDDVREQREAVARIHREWWVNGKPAERRLSVLTSLARFGREWLLDLRHTFDPYHVGESVLSVESEALPVSRANQEEEA